MPIGLLEIATSARIRRARERLDRLEEMHDALRLSEHYSQREIAEVLGTTQPRVHRMLKAMEGRSADVETPEEIILRAIVADVDGPEREQMIQALIGYDYTFREYAPEPLEGAIEGTWDEVTHASMTGLLSEEEYERVRDAVQPPRP
ncbi:hypothetical protein [Nocardioides sp. zg-DK7169]|uniref:hypothetical protein n=1 Tax=Nocardioides sp. zg-DK7169 TaxID=2736600 RepID=UPI001552B994|nr:hypothetical protein [Nocardioides sp. zg-DK7169]NPC97245.1 hypothetical protein [Nocardioides sp. zg-DK7169]